MRVSHELTLVTQGPQVEGLRGEGDAGKGNGEKEGRGEAKGDVIGRDRVAGFSRADARDTMAAGGNAAMRGAVVIGGTQEKGAMKRKIMYHSGIQIIVQSSQYNGKIALLTNLYTDG